VAGGEVAARFALDHPNSAYARSLRAIRARLLRSSKKPRGEILAVVSALTGEGKSTFASNFALAAEHSGVRTLLIDGDVYAASSTLAYSLQRAGLLEVLPHLALRTRQPWTPTNASSPEPSLLGP